MKKSPTDNTPPSDQDLFLQDGSLLTRRPSEQRSKEPQIVLPKADQKIVSPTSPVLAQLDSQGLINITVPASALTLGKLLGEGAVYQGLYNGEPVAIKRLKTQDLTDKAVEELRNEASIMFQLGPESKYTVPLKKICLESPYSLVMELMPKGSLYHLLRNRPPLPWEIRFQIALDVAWGLMDLHSHFILHGDLKSLNILLDDRLRAKLANFGLAKVKHQTSSSSRVAKGTVLWMDPELFDDESSRVAKGTVLWMAPELFDDEPKMTTASDVYSFGMVLWELVTRMLPYDDAPNQGVAARWIKAGEKEDIPNGCPPELKPIIESCWESLPAQRPTAAQLVERLKPLVTDQEQKMRSSVPESPKPVAAAGSAESEQMNKLLIEVIQLKFKESSEDERRRVELEKIAEDHARLKEELERGREIRRREAELKKSPSAPKLETPASSPPVRQPEIKKPVTSEPVSPPSSVLSQSRFTIVPAPKPLIKPVDAKALEQLLRFVAEGEQDKAEALIQKDDNLLLQAGPVTDLSGREFKGITAFQYALWAMDWHMWTMIQEYLPQEAQAQQFEALESKGTAYGKHFSLQPLTEALQTYMDNAEKWGYDKRASDHWYKVVGGAQKELPAHVVNEYCRRDRPFYPCPQEWESTLPRTRETERYYDGTQWVEVSWFIAPPFKDGVELNVAFYRSVLPDVMWSVLPWGRERADGELQALQSLWETRTQQLELLRSQLSIVSQSQVLGS